MQELKYVRNVELNNARIEELKNVRNEELKKHVLKNARIELKIKK